jgi:transposase-like protein
MRSEMAKVRQRSQAEKKAAEEHEAGRTAREMKELLAILDRGRSNITSAVPSARQHLRCETWSE